jgi:4'-phosphopantetheinyl transferase EntD
LLADTPAHDHNEVLFSAKDAVVKAFFWVEPQVKDEVPPYTREEVIGMARNAGLPFLELDLLKY